MNLLHGDHVTHEIVEGRVIAAIDKSPKLGVHIRFVRKVEHANRITSARSTFLGPTRALSDRYGGGYTDDFEVYGDKTGAVVGELKCRRILNRVSVIPPTIGSQRTSNQPTTACRASTAFLTAPMTLSASSPEQELRLQELVQISIKILW